MERGENTVNERQTDQATPPPRHNAHPRANSISIDASIGAQPEMLLHQIANNQQKQPTPPSSYPSTTRPSPVFPVISYLPPPFPQTPSGYITQFSPTGATTQPYLQPDAPCHESSYHAFINGIRMRAHVPNHVFDEKLALVLAYGWNNSCRVVRHESNWSNKFIEGLKSAARRVVIACRVGVCCVPS